jgi:hypothetical protein
VPDIYIVADEEGNEMILKLHRSALVLQNEVRMLTET